MLRMNSAEQGASGARASMRSYFSTQHLWSAKRFAATATEAENVEGVRPRFDLAHRSFAVSSLIASAAFMEAAVSEIFQDAADDHGLTDGGYLSQLKPDSVSKMADLWREMGRGSLRRKDPIEKAQRLLECCGEIRLDSGRSPVQHARDVLVLRNELIHFKPESIEVEATHPWERRLRGKFPDNALMFGASNPWWPDHALGAGCAMWAYESARQLLDAVVGEVGIVPNYARIESRGWMGSPPQMIGAPAVRHPRF
jgi:hypothetical protein